MLIFVLNLYNMTSDAHIPSSTCLLYDKSIFLKLLFIFYWDLFIILHHLLCTREP